jgi:hypothetical protein
MNGAHDFNLRSTFPEAACERRIGELTITRGYREAMELAICWPGGLDD